MEKEDLTELLKSEYFHIQSVIEDFDSRTLSIKAWSVSFSLAALGAAFASEAPIVLILASASSLMFWTIEAYWKSFQLSYYPRLNEIEKFFRDESNSITPLQTSASWGKSWRQNRKKNLMKVWKWPHVALPHALITLIGPVLFLLVKLNLISI